MKGKSLLQRPCVPLREGEECVGLDERRSSRRSGREQTSRVRSSDTTGKPAFSSAGGWRSHAATRVRSRLRVPIRSVWSEGCWR